MATHTALANQLGAILKRQNLMLVLAESCTGGMVSQFITSVAGSSAWFDRAYITYSNQAKMDCLNVSKSTLERYGAVSEQVAFEMAHGAFNIGPSTDKGVADDQLSYQYANNLNAKNTITTNELTQSKPDVIELKNQSIKSNCFVAASITGIAGPSNRSVQPSTNPLDLKPVGLVCFGFTVNNQTSTCTQYFKGTRRQIRLQASYYVMQHLITLLSQSN